MPDVAKSEQVVNYDIITELATLLSCSYPWLAKWVILPVRSGYPYDRMVDEISIQ